MHYILFHFIHSYHTAYLCSVLPMLSTDEIKKLVAEKAVGLVKEGMVLGIGSGSTVAFFIEVIARKFREGLVCTCVPTSSLTELLAAKAGIKLTKLNDVSSIDLTIDGADEADHHLQLIKGGGGYLLQEKMVAASSRELVIIADNKKYRKCLGEFPLPVEVIPYGWKQVRIKIENLFGIEIKLREKEGKPFTTDHGHFILDCSFQKIEDPAGLNSMLHLIPGIVETGLFVDMCNKAIIGYPDGNTQIIEKAAN
jgi:ribose 5-phosphate isomerase A